MKILQQQWNDLIYRRTVVLSTMAPVVQVVSMQSEKGKKVINLTQQQDEEDGEKHSGTIHPPSIHLKNSRTGFLVTASGV